MFTRSATWIHLEPLSFSAVSSLVSRTLRRSKEECQPLSRLIHAASLGNAFSIRNMLTTLQRQHLVSPAHVGNEFPLIIFPIDYI